MEDKKLTAANGRLVADNQNVQTVGPRGPMVLQDPWFIEKLAHFDSEVIPERRMHAKGSGAFGTFTVALIKLIAPVTIDMIDSVSLPALHIMTCVIAFVMIADTVKTVKCMDSSKLWYVEKQAEFMNELRNGRCVGLVKKIKDTFRR